MKHWIDTPTRSRLRGGTLRMAGPLLALPALAGIALAQTAGTLDVPTPAQEWRKPAGSLPTFSSAILRASPDDLQERTAAAVTLSATYLGTPDAHEWMQLAGPRVPLADLGPRKASADLTGLEVAVDVELVFQLRLTFGGATETATASVHVRPLDMTPMLGPNVQLGGATTAVAIFEDDGTPWVLYNVGNRFSTTTVGVTAGPVYSLPLSGTVQDILVVERPDLRRALVAMGSEGIALVDVLDPTGPRWLGTVTVNYHQDGLTWTEGGGDILYEQVISGTSGTITALATDGTTLWIADADYGIHATALANLLGPTGPVLEPDGTLLVEREAYTLQYAGEVPWGAPRSLDLVRGRLFVALEFLGLGIYDAASLDMVGRYNLYTDVDMLEDWFLDLDPAEAVQPGFLDPFTGMPSYEQVSWEILNAHGGQGSGEEILTPWADFERYGKYYYHSQEVDVVHYPTGSSVAQRLGAVETPDQPDAPGRTIAFVAYGLGGLVAVDVTGFQAATAGAFLEAEYLGYAPAVPAHGPDEFIGTHNENLFPHFGSGMLKESGVVDVHVVERAAYFSDHFAGLAVISAAHAPERYWKGALAPYDNDENGILGDHTPDYEFVTSYDMSPYDPTDHESLPTWMYERPARLVTGEIGGHGNAFVLMPDMRIAEGGNVDVVMGLGAGGLDFVDLVDLSQPLSADRFEVMCYFPTTDEVGAAPDGSPTATISMGHSQGVAASERYLYVADGPHGLLTWKLVDELGYPTDDLHLVANTVQDEYPVVVGGTTVFPATHAYGVVYDPVRRAALTLCQGVGLRRVLVGGVEDDLCGIGWPLLLGPRPEDIFEHNGAWGKIPDLDKQDHAYDVALDGDLAFVADGGNGLTVYDLTKDPTVLTSGFFVGNLGGTTQVRPELGRSTGIALWRSPADGRRYAILAAGPFGVGVADAEDPTDPVLVKIFEPIKLEDEKVGKADGRCVDVFVRGDHAYFTYDSFGVLCYALEDLVEPLPPGVEPTKIWKVQGGVVLFDHRPEAVGEFRLREEPGYEEWGGGALNMSYTDVDDELVLYVAYGVAGLARIGWSDPAAPVLLDVAKTAGEASAVALSLGRAYVADSSGGLVGFK